MLIKRLSFLILTITSAVTFGCTTSAHQISHQSLEHQTEAEVNQEVETKVSDEPVSPIDENSYTKGLQIAWRKFTQNGQYRLIRNEDRQYSEKTLTKVGVSVGSLYSSYVYLWGDLNYKRDRFDDHLAAIVEDTTRNDDNRFGLVIFSPSKNSKDSYDINWLYKNRDLSKTTINRASGHFPVQEHFDDGTFKTCFVEWNKKLKKFICK